MVNEPNFSSFGSVFVEHSGDKHITQHTNKYVYWTLNAPPTQRLHLCHLSGIKGSPAGQALVSESDANGGQSQNQSQSCGSGEFQCANGHCIPETWTCDFDDDCGDRSDETLPQCATPTCGNNHFQVGSKWHFCERVNALSGVTSRRSELWRFSRPRRGFLLKCMNLMHDD